MYKSENLHHKTRRMEYKLAWNYFMEEKLNKIFVSNFDNETPEMFQENKTKVLYRYGLGFSIFNRQLSFYDTLLQAFNEPLIVNSKHYVQRQMKIKAHLWKNPENKYIDSLK